MSRKKRTIGDVRGKFRDAEPPGNGRHRLHHEWNGMQFFEVLSLVCKYFCRGMNASQIRDEMATRHKIEMTREKPYEFIAYAASHKWIKYIPPVEYVLREQLRESYPWLQAVEVVNTAVFDDVAYQGAKMLLNLVKGHKSRGEVHVGFAGGHAMQKLAAAFAQLLRQPTEGLPETIVFHAMVAAFNVYGPTTSPDGIFSLFGADPAMQVKTKFVCLHAPAVVKARQYKGLRRAEGIREAVRAASRLDIIVTSASLWDDPDNELRKHMKRFPEALASLTAAGCVADMLWSPLSLTGPINIETGVRPMTLLGLSDVSQRIRDGAQLLLAIGPCQGCGRPKTKALEAILNANPRILTHVVMDTLSARPLCGSSG